MEKNIKKKEYIYIYMYSFFLMFFSIMAYHRILNIEKTLKNKTKQGAVTDSDFEE